MLERKGFILDRARGSHRIYYHPETKKRAVVPFHKKDVPRGTLLEILRQAGISKDELGGLL
ncbi:MAG: type II toxin-antitoxin system HicA family toxin [Thermoflexales bacterium]|nr:type II toxin-antitoxin system HicA family toxin [Thermoflexales bacterium]